MERMHEGDDATPVTSGGSWRCESSSERLLETEKHDHGAMNTTARSPQSSLQTARSWSATFRDGGMIRSRVLRDPSCFFINWPKRQRALPSFARLTGLIRPEDQ
jgi:hypothetical protein